MLCIRVVDQSCSCCGSLTSNNFVLNKVTLERTNKNLICRRLEASNFTNSTRCTTDNLFCSLKRCTSRKGGEIVVKFYTIDETIESRFVLVETRGNNSVSTPGGVTCKRSDSTASSRGVRDVAIVGEAGYDFSSAVVRNPETYTTVFVDVSPGVKNDRLVRRSSSSVKLVVNTTVNDCANTSLGERRTLRNVRRLGDWRVGVKSYECTLNCCCVHILWIGYGRNESCHAIQNKILKHGSVGHVEHRCVLVSDTSNLVYSDVIDAIFKGVGSCPVTTSDRHDIDGAATIFDIHNLCSLVTSTVRACLTNNSVGSVGDKSKSQSLCRRQRTSVWFDNRCSHVITNDRNVLGNDQR